MGDITEKRRRHYSGVAADRLTIPAGGKAVGDWFLATDTGIIYYWDGATWVDVTDLSAVIQNVVPAATNVISLGSAAKHWAYLYTRSLYVDPTFGVSSDLNPDTQNAYDLGGGTWPWRNLYALNAYLTNLKQDLAVDAGIKVDGVDISAHKHTAAAGDAPKILVTGLANDAVETIKIKDANVTLAKLAPDAMGDFGHKLLHTQDQRAANTAGGTFTSGAWRTRVLNTVLTNEIAGASLASNQITLPIGTYFLLARAPAHQVNRHKIRLYDTTGAAAFLIGSSAFAANGSPFDSDSDCWGRFTVGVESVIELQHISQTTFALVGFGSESNLGVIEVYSDVLIWKV